MIKAKNGKVYMKGNNIDLTDDIMCIIATICEKDDLLPMRLVLEKTLNLNFTELKELQKDSKIPFYPKQSIFDLDKEFKKRLDFEKRQITMF